jgi:hypothetical protein
MLLGILGRLSLSQSDVLPTLATRVGGAAFLFQHPAKGISAPMRFFLALLHAGVSQRRRFFGFGGLCRYPCSAGELGVLEIQGL